MTEQSVEFKGMVAGDGDCMCFEVDETTYRRIVGDDQWEMELALFEEEGRAPYWRLYVNDLLNFLGCGEHGQDVGLILTRTE